MMPTIRASNERTTETVSFPVPNRAHIDWCTPGRNFEEAERGLI